MAEQSYPFENQSTSESQYSTLFRLLADTGVAGSTATADLRPYGDSSGMFVKVPTGTALVRGFLYVNDSLLTLPVAAAAASQRVDSVVLRLDPAANTITATVKQGSPGGGAPALTQTDAGTYEVRLGDVTVPAGATTVAAGQVTDRRPFTSLPVGKWTTDNRPAGAARGKFGFNETSGRPEFWDGNTWQSFATQAALDQEAADRKTDTASIRGNYGFGTWYPQFGGTNANQGDNAGADGDWQRVGNVWTLTGRLAFGSSATWGTGNASIVNLPFNYVTERCTGSGVFYNAANGSMTPVALTPGGGNSLAIRPYRQADPVYLGNAFQIGGLPQSSELKFQIVATGA